MLTAPRWMKSNILYLKQLRAGEAASPFRSVIGLGRQEVHFVLGRDANDLGDVSQIVKPIEQRFELLRRRYPEQRPRRLVRFVEIAVWNAARQSNQIAGLGLHPYAIEFQVQHAVLDQDKFLLGGMDMNRDKLAG